jgi:protein phosphatase
VWIFNSESSPLQWSKLDIKEEVPSARVYHTASVCNYGYANGMMVIFGGRRKDGQVLNDMWGLRRHRNGSWDWTKAPYKGTPKDRLQHASLFCGNFFINIGGRSSSDGDNLPIEVYDTETSEWHIFMNFKRFRHACFIIENFMYIHGGLEDEKHNNPAKVLNEINLLEAFEKDAVILPKLQNYLAEKKKPSSPNSNGGSSPNTSGRNGQGSERGTLGDKTNDKILRLSDTVQVAANKNQDNMDFNQMVREFSAKRLHNENVKQEDLVKFFKQPKEMEIQDKIISALLRPKEWIERQSDILMEQDMRFDIDMDIIIDLITKCQKIVEDQPMVLRVDAPVKVFGDIHGQYVDLMRFFDLYSAPIEGAGGDIEGLDYIFLGDYVDRGTHSLETMCLLMALKVKYPNQIHLLRGNHEDRWINTTFGFQLELNQRANDDPDNPILFNAFNDFFDRLPLAAIVNESVLCIHGGIGSSISSISDIEKIRRPLEVIHEVTNIDQQLVVDILWSDPTDSDIEVGIQPNITRDPTGVGNIVKFGPDRVNEFLKNNNLSLILRAHECVMDGFERFAGGQLITVFSATDYCGKHKNAGAILFLTNRFEIKPYLIYPNTNINKNWDNSEETLKLRPPTPPRTRANTNESRGSNNDMNRKNSFS